MKAIALSLVILLLPGVVGAQALYKWTDKQGVVHYSQLPPDDRSFEERHVKAHDPKAQATTAKGSTGAELRKQNCDNARKNLEVLKTAKQVYVQQPKAEGADAAPAKAGAGQAAAAPKAATVPAMLTDEQRAAELKSAESQIQLFCEA